MDFAAATDWWRDAGVDLAFADDATDWLAQPAIADNPKSKYRKIRPQAINHRPKKSPAFFPNKPLPLISQHFANGG